MKHTKGFTLIELLVVIAIIGLLSTMAVVSLNSARTKARDAKRMSDVRQLANVLAIEATNNDGSTALTGCGIGDSVTTCTGPGQVSTFDRFEDPSSATACSGTPAAPCQYSIVADTTLDGAQILFYLEDGAGGLSQGPYTITATGVIAAVTP